MTMELAGYRYRGARALVLLHERRMREFLEAWRAARAAGTPLPQTDDPTYTSWGTLLRHVLRWARGYLIWICEKLELPDPAIRPVPEADVVAAEVDTYLEHLLRRWRVPLANVEGERIFKPAYPAPWKVEHSVESMLEHAVMHPVRHRFQLEELIERA